MGTKSGHESTVRQFEYTVIGGVPGGAVNSRGRDKIPSHMIMFPDVIVYES